MSYVQSERMFGGIERMETADLIASIADGNLARTILRCGRKDRPEQKILGNRDPQRELRKIRHQVNHLDTDPSGSNGGRVARRKPRSQ